MVPRRRTALLLTLPVLVAACSSGRGAGTTATLGGLPGVSSIVATTSPPPRHYGADHHRSRRRRRPAPPTTAAPTTIAPATTAAPPTTTVPAVDVAAYAVYDMRAGEVLAVKRRNAELPVGSLMKLLTAKVAYNAGEPTRVITVPDNLLLDPEESNIGLIPGEELPRDVLIRAMLIVQRQRRGPALARDIAGDEAAYAELMNGAAGDLGLRHTHAVNVTGLDADGQHSSAMDMIRLGTHLMSNPTFQLTVERSNAVLHDLRYPPTNDLLTLYPGADGSRAATRPRPVGACSARPPATAGGSSSPYSARRPRRPATRPSSALLDWGFTAVKTSRIDCGRSRRASAHARLRRRHRRRGTRCRGPGPPRSWPPTATSGSSPRPPTAAPTPSRSGASGPTTSTGSRPRAGRIAQGRQPHRQPPRRLHDRRHGRVRLVEGTAAILDDGARRETWIARYLSKYLPIAPELTADFLRANVVVRSRSRAGLRDHRAGGRFRRAGDEVDVRPSEAGRRIGFAPDGVAGGGRRGRADRARGRVAHARASGRRRGRGRRRRPAPAARRRRRAPTRRRAHGHPHAADRHRRGHPGRARPSATPIPSSAWSCSRSTSRRAGRSTCSPTGRSGGPTC